MISKAVRYCVGAWYRNAREAWRTVIAVGFLGLLVLYCATCGDVPEF